MIKNSHCSYCGHAFSMTAWPRHCLNCSNTTWRNPLPVGVLLVPIDSGLLLIRRGIEPNKGEVALPGGYLDCDETWQQGCARELREETQIEIDPDTITLANVISSPSNSLLIFGITPPQSMELVKSFVPNEEVTEMMVLNTPIDLAFASHTKMMQWFFDARQNPSS